MKKIIFISVILCGLIFLFWPEAAPDDFQLPNILESAGNNDVIIIFNSGGWGNTPFEEAWDFAPIIKGVQQTLSEWGYNSMVIPYIRTKDDFLEKVAGLKEFFNFYKNSSEDLAEEIEILAQKFPDKKIIMAGLSNGGTFVTETYKKISEDTKKSVYTIAAGTPFWTEKARSENILQLNNNGEDSLCVGEVKTLLLSLLKIPFRWLASESQVFYSPGHEYYWPSSEVNPQIVTFLEDKFR